MANGIYSALSGAVSNERRVEMISHNVANVNTSGFQPFQMALESVKAVSGNDETLFAMPAAIEADTRSGPIVATGNPLDVALTEGVHIAVTDGTRNGYVHGATLMVRPDGRLTTTEGLAVLGKEGPISVPANARDVEVGPDGDVTADGGVVDKLRLVEFANPKALKAAEGRIVFDGGGAGERPTTAVSPVMSGYVEKPNYSAVQGMSGLIVAHRSYDAMIKLIETYSALEKRTAREVSK
jgi:flagellar basal-body rod protein FlgF